MLSTANQVYIFLSTVYAGIIIGLIYDCYRMVRRILRAGRFVTGLLDLSFWLVIGVLSFLVVFHVNDGQVRVYTILGFLIGWALYALALSPYVMKVFQFVYNIIARTGKIVLAAFLWPFRLIKKILLPFFKFVKKLILRMARWLKSSLNQLWKKKNNKNKEL